MTKRILLMLAICLAPSAANADSTCDTLFDNMRQYAKRDALNYLHVHWTTNYHSKYGRYMGWTEITLRLRGVSLQELVGTGTRRRQLDREPAYTPQDGKIEESVSLLIRLDGKVVLSDQYGPYDPTCSPSVENTLAGYAVLRTGDSVEVLNFRPKM